MSNKHPCCVSLDTDLIFDTLRDDSVGSRVATIYDHITNHCYGIWRDDLRPAHYCEYCTNAISNVGV